MLYASIDLLYILWYCMICAVRHVSMYELYTVYSRIYPKKLTNPGGRLLRLPTHIVQVGTV